MYRYCLFAYNKCVARHKKHVTLPWIPFTWPITNHSTEHGPNHRVRDATLYNSLQLSTTLLCKQVYKGYANLPCFNSILVAQDTPSATVVCFIVVYYFMPILSTTYSPFFIFQQPGQFEGKQNFLFQLLAKLLGFGNTYTFHTSKSN